MSAAELIKLKKISRTKMKMLQGNDVGETSSMPELLGGAFVVGKGRLLARLGVDRQLR